MRFQYRPPWSCRVGWVVLSVVIGVLLIINHSMVTHAIGGVGRLAPTARISALHTNEALQVSTDQLVLGEMVQGEQTSAQLAVQNIWSESLVIGVELVDLPGWTAGVDEAVLGPGGSAVVHLTGLPEKPGELAGEVRITALGDFLSLKVAVTGQVAPKPKKPHEITEPPAESTEPPAESTEPPAESTEPPAESTEPPAEVTEVPAESTED